MKPSKSSTRLSRRKFAQGSLLTAGVALSNIPAMSAGAGETLYNGIVLPEVWPPRNMEPDSHEPMPVPYLQSPPSVIPVDVGRQLFVDDFLISNTDLKRRFHQPVKYEGNPVLFPETEVEMNKGFCPTAAPFSDGCFYDPECGHFKLYYMAGWFDGVALATSMDGIHWERPVFDVVPGTNLVLKPEKLRRDGVSVWLDHNAKNRNERFKMYYWARTGDVGGKLTGGCGYILTSADGIHWDWRGEIGKTGDNSTFFRNPFRDVWVFTVRRFGRPAPPWAGEFGWSKKKKKKKTKQRRGRARSYWENKDLMAALGGWSGYEPVFWFGADKLDPRRPGYDAGRVPQMYKVDAVGYESLMLGLVNIHYGPPNSDCAKEGAPKLTELQLAFSRDGFHWDRSNRETFIGATLEKDSWERAYIHSIGGVCNVVGDKLHFYYTAFRGDENNRNPDNHWNGMYANASTGLAILRRDGFASMDAGRETGTLTTAPLVFKGKYLFVNVDCPDGALRAEIIDLDGNAIAPFSVENCMPVSCDKTLAAVSWKGAGDLSGLAGKPVRIRFHLANGSLYSFWVSPDKNGASHGYVAAGGPGFTGSTDEIGCGVQKGS